MGLFLFDHETQFKERWKDWCGQHGVEAMFAHPFYPQDKGKVERFIQNLNCEFDNHLRRFPEWLKDRLSEHRDWFNYSRYHRRVRHMLLNIVFENTFYPSLTSLL